VAGVGDEQLVLRPGRPRADAVIEERGEAEREGQDEGEARQEHGRPLSEGVMRERLPQDAFESRGSVKITRNV